MALHERTTGVRNHVPYRRGSLWGDFIVVLVLWVQMGSMVLWFSYTVSVFFYGLPMVFLRFSIFFKIHL